ncbi:MAG: ATP-binding protein, partial [Alphaproteobacteria bacterium]
MDPKAQPTPLAALSHEFRTPLNAVLGMARLLEGTRLTAEQKTYVAALKSSGDHLLALVGDVLDMARLEAGAVTLNLQPVNVADLLQTVAELLSPRAHEKGLEIASVTPKGLPMVMADEGRLRQVMFNLAGNAVKFTHTGGVLLGCDFEILAQDRVRLRLTVRDTGPGVPADRQSSIFEAFTHAHDGDGALPDSTGLGLAIVKRLAEACHGSAGVESKPGEGSTFWFEAVFEPAGEARTDEPLAGVTVMIVSPSLIVREAAARQVEAAGGKAMTCELAEDAQRRAPPGVVVLIDESPGKLRPIAGHPCLVLLRPESRPRIDRSRAAGFAGYLIKP